MEVVKFKYRDEDLEVEEEEDDLKSSWRDCDWSKERKKERGFDKCWEKDRWKRWFERVKSSDDFEDEYGRGDDDDDEERERCKEKERRWRDKERGKRWFERRKSSDFEDGDEEDDERDKC